MRQFDLDAEADLPTEVRFVDDAAEAPDAVGVADHRAVRIEVVGLGRIISVRDHPLAAVPIEAEPGRADRDLGMGGTGLSQQGLFTPALDGPNPARNQSKNNIGDVYVVASYTPSGANARPLKARSIFSSCGT